MTDQIARESVVPPHPELDDLGRYQYGWSDSDTNYYILGLIVETATGRSLGVELRRRIFAPLRLRATSFPTAPDIAGRHAHGYFLRPRHLCHQSSAQATAKKAKTISTITPRRVGPLMDGVRR